MKTVRSGMLHREIIFQRVTEVKDEYGQTVSSWSNLLETRAYINALSGAERWISEHLLNTVTHQVVIRNPRGSFNFTPKDRIIYGTRIFDIISIRDFEERQTLLNILVKERYDEVYTPPVSTTSRRLLENGDIRITQSGDTRTLEN